MWNERNKKLLDEEQQDTNSKTVVLYDEYKRKYCLNYIRAFFNQHLDDTWFRARYSPAEQQRFAVTERNRSIQEARALLNQIIVQDDTACFRAGARLGGRPKSIPNPDPPVSHMFSWQQPGNASQALLVTNIASAVTDEHLVLALLNNYTKDVPPPDLTVYAGTFIPTAGPGVLQRNAIIVGQAAVMQIIWNKLCDITSIDLAVLRKEHNQDEPVVLEVDCTDPYGRIEYDADGRGGAPMDGSKVPSKTVSVSVQRLATTTPTTVLTAALSSTTRHASDKKAALRWAQSLDKKRQIPVDCGIAQVVEKLFGDNQDNDEDVLDVCIAYLRRVHLVSFYNGCDQPAKAVADTLTGKHPASTIHFRCQDADATLESAAEKVKDSEKVDMLVQRLDDSIQKAMDDCEKTDALASSATGDELLSLQLGLPVEVIQDVKAIESAEDRAGERWILDHSTMDDDQRARCSFHFCRKLFRDTAFLEKHLVKKHVEYLSSEKAKTHDEYMMKAWDSASERPIPDVLVDCGSRFGLLASSVRGQVPDCVDPEPDLWKREEEGREKHEREMMMRDRRDESRQQHHNYKPKEVEPVRRSIPFVHVDDMKVEKVEMSFENVEIPAVVVLKTKKKKRKLL